MKPDTNSRILIALILLSLFTAFMFIVIFTYHLGTEGDNSPIIDALFRYHFYLMTIMGAMGIAVGALSYYLMSKQVERKSGIAKQSTEVLLRFLSPDERKVINKMIDGNGKTLQANLTREMGLSKVKIHRIVNKLKSRDILIITEYGKTNALQLNNDILEALK